MFQTKAYNGQSIVINPDILNRKWYIMGNTANEKPLLIVFEASGRILNESFGEGMQWRIENHHLIILDKERNIKYRSLKICENKEILLYNIKEDKEIKLFFYGFFCLENLLKDEKLEEIIQPISRNSNHVQTIFGGKIIRYEKNMNMNKDK